MKKVSVVIPTYDDSWPFLKACLQSLVNQTLVPKEIIVVGGKISVRTRTELEKHFPKIKKVFIDDNMGVTGGRNKGIDAVSKNSDYFFFFDHDMIADSNMLAELANVAEINDDIGIVTPKIYYWSNKKRIWSAGTNINLWTGQVLFRGGKDKGQFDKIEAVQVAPASMLVKRGVIDKVKYFDNRYFATFEDTDFCFRAKKFGFSTFYAPKAIAYHDLSVNLRDESDRLFKRAYWVGRNRVLFMKDFGRFFYIFLVFIPVYLVYYLHLAIKYRRLNDWLIFVKGTFFGIFSHI